MMKVGVTDYGTIGSAPQTGERPAPIVFLHAFPVDGRMWDQAAHALLETGGNRPELAGTRVFAFNTPGTPSVSIPPASECGPIAEDGTYPQAITLLAKAFVAQLHQLGFDRAIWVGLSMGGYEALAIELAEPEAVEAMALCDSVAHADDAQHRAGRMEMARRARGDEGSDAVMKFARPQPGDSAYKKSAAFIDMMTRWIHDQSGAGLYWREQMAGGRPDLSGALDSLNKRATPFLVVSGQRDPSAGPRVMLPLSQRVHGSTFVEIPDAGHFSAVEKPGLFAMVIAQFASDVARGAARTHGKGTKASR
jgi:pimeloyl-ACP methyl ester carboxylesterase